MAQHTTHMRMRRSASGFCDDACQLSVFRVELLEHRINARRKYLPKPLRIDSSVLNCLLSLPFQMTISFQVFPAPIALSGGRITVVFFKLEFSKLCYI